MKKGVAGEAAEKIFRKFHGLYQFPEAHAYAFGVTAYQMSWIKRYPPLEFFVALFNNQPMGFYNLETLKEDARRHDIEVLGPDVNLSGELATMEDDALRIGLKHVARVQSATVDKIMTARRMDGPFRSLADFMARTGLQEEPLDNLAKAGALDLFDSHYRPRRHRTGKQGRRLWTPAGNRTGVFSGGRRACVTGPSASNWRSTCPWTRTWSRCRRSRNGNA